MLADKTGAKLLTVLMGISGDSAAKHLLYGPIPGPKLSRGAWAQSAPRERPDH